MAHLSPNMYRLFHRHNLPNINETFSENNPNNSDKFKPTDYSSILSNFIDRSLNASLIANPADSNIYKESEITAEHTTKSENYFPLAVLLKESWWNVFNEKYLRHSWGWTVTLISVYVFILVAGVIGNCMVILVVALRPKMKTVTNIFIMNLAVADLFVIVFGVGPTLLANIFQRK